MKTRTLKKDTVLVYVGYLLKLLSPIILVPYYGRVLGPESYGRVLAATSFMSIISVIIDYGFHFPAIREIASSKDREERSRVYSRQIFARSILLPIAFVIGGIGMRFSEGLTSNVWFGILAIATGTANAFTFGWLFQGLRMFKMSIAVQALPYPLNIALVLFYVRGPNDGLHVLLCLFATGIVCAALCFFLARKHVDVYLPTMRECMGEIKKSTVFFYTSVSFTLITSGSTYILSILSTPTQVGYFGPAERIINLGFSLLGPLAQVLLPTLSLLHGDAPDTAFKLARKGLFVEAAYGLLAVAVGLPFASLVIPFLLGHQFEPTVLVFQILLIVMPFIAVKHAISMYILIPQKRESMFLITTTINIATNLVVALVVSGTMGASGMAIARVSGEVLTTVILVITVNRMGLLKGLFRREART